MNRREFVVGTTATAAAASIPVIAIADSPRPRYSKIVGIETYFPEAETRANARAHFDLWVGKRRLLYWDHSTLAHVYWEAGSEAEGFIVRPDEIIRPVLHPHGEQGIVIVDLVHIGSEGKTDQRIWFEL